MVALTIRERFLSGYEHVKDVIIKVLWNNRSLRLMINDFCKKGEKRDNDFLRGQLRIIPLLSLFMMQ